MRERDFEEYLLSDESIKSKMKAVNSRLSKARLMMLFPMTKNVSYSYESKAGN